MDRGAWWATVHGDHKRLGQDLATEAHTGRILVVTRGSLVTSCVHGYVECSRASGLRSCSAWA